MFPNSKNYPVVYSEVRNEFTLSFFFRIRKEKNLVSKPPTIRPKNLRRMVQMNT